MGSRRVRQGRVRPVLPGVDARTARLHQAGHRGRGPVDRLMRRPVVSERRTRARRVPHRQLDERRARQGPQTPVEPGAPRRRREIRQAHARRQIRRVEEPRRPDRQTVRGLREPAGHGPQGPALPRRATQGTIEDPAQAPARTGPGRTEPLGVPGVPQPHPRDRRTREEIRRRRPDILRTIQLGYSNARLEAFNNRIKAPSAWPTASTTSATSSPSSCSAAADSTSDYHNPQSNPRKQQKPRFCWICGPLPSAFVPSRLTPIMATPITSIENA